VSATVCLRAHRLGTYFACCYLLPVSALIGATWYFTKPENVGYDWIPAYIATMPWSRLRVWISLGAIINAAVLYAVGAFLGFINTRLRVRPPSHERDSFR